MKIGIFGGTFDPFTFAHFEIVNKAFDIVDSVIIVPTTISYYRDGKTPLFTYEQRVKIISAFINRFWKNKSVSCSTLEQGKNSFWRTADTVRELKKTYPTDELYFILGSDSFNEIESWSEFEFLKENLKFIVVDGRDGFPTTNSIPHETITIEKTTLSASLVRENLIDSIMHFYIKGIFLS